MEDAGSSATWAAKYQLFGISRGFPALKEIEINVRLLGIWAAQDRLANRYPIWIEKEFVIVSRLRQAYSAEDVSLDIRRIPSKCTCPSSAPQSARVRDMTKDEVKSTGDAIRVTQVEYVISFLRKDCLVKRCTTDQPQFCTAEINTKSPIPNLNESDRRCRFLEHNNNIAIVTDHRARRISAGYGGSRYRQGYIFGFLK